METILNKKLESLSPQSNKDLRDCIVSIKDDLNLSIPNSLKTEFDQYQFNRNKQQLITITIIGVLIHSLFYLPTHYFVPDMVGYDSVQRITMVGLFAFSMLYVFTKKNRATYIDIFICGFTIVSAILWLIGCYLSKEFETPSFLIANATFVFTSSILIKTRLFYSVLSAIIISCTTIFVMLGKYHDITRAFYEITFIFLPIVIFGLVFSWQNIENGKRKFLQEALDHLEKANLSSDNKDLQSQAETDVLTNIANRRAFESQYNHFLYRISNPAEKLAVLITDIDFFKQYNDNYGHLAGDDALQRIASTLKNLVPNHHAHLFRFGGEEFVIVQNYKDSSNITTLSAAIGQAIRSLALPHEHRPDDKNIITISVGASLYDESEHNNLIDMLHDADEKLYKVKASGRDNYLV